MLKQERVFINFARVYRVRAPTQTSDIHIRMHIYVYPALNSSSNSDCHRRRRHCSSRSIE